MLLYEEHGLASKPINNVHATSFFTVCQETFSQMDIFVMCKILPSFLQQNEVYGT